jgi:prevent-host-death family protein
MVAVKAYIYMDIHTLQAMDTINVTQARNDLFRVMDSVLEGRMATITSKKGNAVLVSEEEWNEIIETLYVLSDPDTLPAVIEARKTPTSELEAMDWRSIF